MATTYNWPEFNTAPAGWREISEAEFAQSNYFSETVISTEGRQFVVPYTDRKGKARAESHSVKLLHFWDHTGLALVNEFWDGKVRYFAFGCDHKMVGDGRTETCTVCGWSHPRRDSSG